MAADQVTIVFDFDGTLTHKTGSLFAHVDKRSLSPLALAETDRMREKYLERYRDGLLTEEDELAWLEDSLKLYVRDGLDVAKMEAALAGIRLRPMALDCLRALWHLEIPVAIVSNGVTQFIETVLRNHNALGLVNRIYASHLIADRQGRFISYLRNMLVVPGNKGHFCRLFADSCGRPFAGQLAVGDSAGDRTLGPSRKNRFGLAENDNEMRTLTRFMDAATVCRDFTDATNWLIYRIGRL